MLISFDGSYSLYLALFPLIETFLEVIYRDSDQAVYSHSVGFPRHLEIVFLSSAI